MEALPHVLGINFPASISGSFPDTVLVWVTDTKMQTLPRIKEMRMMELPWQRIEEEFINFVCDNKGCLHQYEPWEIPKGDHKENEECLGERVHRLC